MTIILPILNSNNQIRKKSNKIIAIITQILISNDLNFFILKYLLKYRYNMNIENINKNKIELAFPKYEEEDDDLVSKGEPGEGMIKRLSTSMDAISDWFKQYQVESIELWISGLLESGGITKLIISAKGEGGMKVVLKPKPQ